MLYFLLQDVLSFLENRKENRSWYKGSRIAVTVSNSVDTFFSLISSSTTALFKISVRTAVVPFAWIWAVQSMINDIVYQKRKVDQIILFCVLSFAEVACLWKLQSIGGLLQITSRTLRKFNQIHHQNHLIKLRKCGVNQLIKLLAHSFQLVPAGAILLLNTACFCYLGCYKYCYSLMYYKVLHSQH